MRESSKIWVLVDYLPVSLFSLRSSLTTSKGGKTLLVPTPYSIKLAWTDACFRLRQKGLARTVFEQIKLSRTAVKPPRYAVVNQTFVKIKQQEREAPAGIYDSTIAYREFCYFDGWLTIALEVEPDSTDLIQRVARHINYFGKRGGFFQYLDASVVDILPPGFSTPFNPREVFSGKAGILQTLDDLGKDTRDLFDRINSFSSKSLKLHQHRILVETVIPYRFVKSSRTYTLYERNREGQVSPAET